jgi:hypothetical protein
MCSSFGVSLWPGLGSGMHPQSANRKHMAGGNTHMHKLMFLVSCHAAEFVFGEFQQL